MYISVLIIDILQKTLPSFLFNLHNFRMKLIFLNHLIYEYLIIVKVHLPVIFNECWKAKVII